MAGNNVLSEDGEHSPPERGDVAQRTRGPNGLLRCQHLSVTGWTFTFLRARRVQHTPIRPGTDPTSCHVRLPGLFHAPERPATIGCGMRSQHQRAGCERESSGRGWATQASSLVPEWYWSGRQPRNAGGYRCHPCALLPPTVSILRLCSARRSRCKAEPTDGKGSFGLPFFLVDVIRFLVSAAQVADTKGLSLHSGSWPQVRVPGEPVTGRWLPVPKLPKAKGLSLYSGSWPKSPGPVDDTHRVCLPRISC